MPVIPAKAGIHATTDARSTPSRAQTLRGHDREQFRFLPNGTTIVFIWRAYMTQKIGRYEIIEEIGSGGFATVFKARDTALDRPVAVKVMRPLLMSDADFVARFHREAQVAANLQHPNIVPIYDYGEDNGRLFIVMRLMAEPVAARLAQGSLEWDRAVAWIAQAAAGLDFAHTRNLIHRDIKPDNILLDEMGHVALADFGVVKALEKSTITVSLSGGILGTPAYMAPEVWNGETPTAATDIYALACVFYEMITGAKLFDGPTPPAIMTLHFRQPPLPAQWPERVPPGVTQVLRRALAARPADRYLKATDFMADLASLWPHSCIRILGWNSKTLGNTQF